ncbi:MAG: hypothetical protein AB1454_07870 [Candidatus Auribacterota bacterium]
MRYAEISRAVNAAVHSESIFLACSHSRGTIFTDCVTSVEAVPATNTLKVSGCFQTITLTNLWDNNNASLMIHEENGGNCFQIVGVVSEIIPCDGESNGDTHSLILILKPKHVLCMNEPAHDTHVEESLFHPV